VARRRTILLNAVREREQSPRVVRVNNSFDIPRDNQRGADFRPRVPGEYILAGSSPFSTTRSSLRDISENSVPHGLMNNKVLIERS